MAMSLISSTSITNSKPFLCLPKSTKWRKTKLVSFAISCKTSSTNNYYDVLSLNPNSIDGADEIKKAYRRMALRYHPDVCNPSMKKEESTRMFVQLNEAYKTLSDPVSRQEYDFQLSLSCSERASRAIRNDQVVRNRWQEQVAEMKKLRSRTARKEGSWGSGLRAQNKLRNEE